VRYCPGLESFWALRLVTKDNLNRNNSPTVSWTTFRDWQHHIGKTAVWKEMAQAEVWLRASANTVMSHPVQQKTGTSLIVWVLPASQEKLCYFEVFGHLVSHLDHFYLFLRFVVHFRARNRCQQFVTLTDVVLDMTTDHVLTYAAVCSL